MAEQKLKVVFKWENNVSFLVEETLNDDPSATILEMDENAHLVECWPQIKALLMKYMSAEIDNIGVQMKAP